MCPDDERCLCRAWAESAKIGREHGIFFLSLSQDLDPDRAREWQATAVDPQTGIIVEGGWHDHPTKAMRGLGDKMMAHVAGIDS